MAKPKKTITIDVRPGDEHDRGWRIYRFFQRGWIRPRGDIVFRMFSPATLPHLYLPLW